MRTKNFKLHALGLLLLLAAAFVPAAFAASNTLNPRRAPDTAAVQAPGIATPVLSRRVDRSGGGSGAGNLSTAVDGASDIPIDAAHFPDAVFRQYVSDTFDKDKDGSLSSNEISGATYIDVDNTSISSLKGIEYFTSLKYLWCNENNLTELDVSKCTALAALRCWENSLTTLNVSKNTALTYLNCSHNSLTTLDVSKNTALTDLYCPHNSLTTLDVSKNTALDALSCSFNSLTKLDVSKNTALVTLYCGNNSLTKLDLSQNTALTTLSSGSQNSSADWLVTKTGSGSYPWQMKLKSYFTDAELANIQSSSVKGYTAGGTKLSENYDASTGIVGFSAVPATVRYEYDTKFSGSGNLMSVTVTAQADSTSQPPTITTASLPNATTGKTYSTTFTGTDVAKWELYAGSLPGLTLSSAGVLSGTPTAAGIYNFAVKASNSAGEYVTKYFYLTVESSTEAAPTITTTSLPNATVGRPYSFTFSATGSGTLTWEQSGYAYLYGLEINSKGVISGTPWSAGTYTFTVKVTNDLGFHSKQFSITVDEYDGEEDNTGAPVITTTSLPNATVGRPYSFTFKASGSGTIKWELDGYAYLYGLEIGSTGIISGTPWSAGTYTFKVKAENDLGYHSKQFSITVNDYNGEEDDTGAPVITTTSLPNATVGRPYSFTFAASGSGTMKWEQDGYAYLYGLEIGSTGIISGTPWSTGTYTFKVKATNDLGYHSKQFSITVDDYDGKEDNTGAPVILTPATLPNAIVGRPYSVTLLASGNATITWEQDGYAYLYGLSVGSSGTVSGTPWSTGTYTFKVKASNSLGYHSKQLSVTVTDYVAPPSINTTELPDGEVGTPYSASLSATGESVTWAIADGSLPDGLSLSSEGGISGTPTKAGTFDFTVQAANSGGSETEDLSITIEGDDDDEEEDDDGDIPIDAAHFPDAVFRQYVSDSFDSNKNGSLSSNELSTTGIFVSNKSISSLKGIEYFTFLKYLWCDGNNLTELDLSKLTALETLGCHENKLVKLDLSKCTALVTLFCHSNTLTELNVSKCTALTYLSCHQNELTALDVSSCTELETLYCWSNSLTKLDVNKNTALTTLSCRAQTSPADWLVAKTGGDSYPWQMKLKSYFSNAELANIQSGTVTGYDASGSAVSANYNASTGVIGFVSLPAKVYYEYDTKFSGSGNLMDVTVTAKEDDRIPVDAAHFPDANFRQYVSDKFDTDGDGSLSPDEISSATYIGVSGQSISSLKGIEYFPSLTELYCNENSLTALDVSKCTALTTLGCYGNSLTTLDVSGCTALTALGCSSNNLTKLDVSKNTALKELYCYENSLTTLDVSKNTALTALSCASNKLTALDVTKCTALTELSCSQNSLTGLDVTKNTALTELYCWENGLTALDVSRNTALTMLDCSSNSLTALDVSRLAALTYLSCFNNSLSALDVSKLTGLKELFCYQNGLTELDVSKNTALTTLYCWGNGLGELDLSKLTGLKTLYCSSNSLTELDLSKNTALEALGCGSQTVPSSSGWTVTNTGVGSYPWKTNLGTYLTSGGLFNVQSVTGLDAGGSAVSATYSADSGTAGFASAPAKLYYEYDTKFSGSDNLMDVTVSLTESAQAPAITTAALPGGTVGKAYSATLTATGTTPITWSITGGSLPGSLSLNASTGTITGTPTKAGTFSFTVQASNSGGSDAKTFSVTIVAPSTPGEDAEAPSITTAALPGGTVGTAYSATLAATGTTPITWSIAGGTLPGGLSLNASTGVITGTPTKAGTFSFTVQASNSGGSDAKSLSITIGEASTPGEDAEAPEITTTSLPGGTVGTAYSTTLAATGTTPITWSIAGGSLPGGLSLNASTGAITGTPTKAGTFSFTVQALNSGGSDAKSLSITIGEASTPGEDAEAPEITTTSLPGGTVGTAYSTTLAATGTTPIEWSVNGALPNGLSFSSAGRISGTPAAAGSFTLTVKASNSAGSITKSFTLTVEGEPVITTTGLSSGKVGTSYSATLSATGENISWEKSGGTLPGGLHLLLEGRIDGTPTETGTFTFTVKASNSVGSISRSFTLTIEGNSVAPPTIITESLPDGKLNEEYSAALEADGQGPITWSKSGTLPEGMSLSSEGQITGTPSQAGTFTFNARAQNSGGTTSQKLTLTIEGDDDDDDETAPTITTPTTLPNATLRTPYSLTLEADGTAPITWSLTEDGRLPGGLSLSSDGQITGTPVEAGSFEDITVEARNKAGSTVTTFNLEVDSASDVLFVDYIVKAGFENGKSTYDGAKFNNIYLNIWPDDPSLDSRTLDNASTEESTEKLSRQKMKDMGFKVLSNGMVVRTSLSSSGPSSPVLDRDSDETGTLTIDGGEAYSYRIETDEGEEDEDGETWSFTVAEGIDKEFDLVKSDEEYYSPAVNGKEVAFTGNADTAFKGREVRWQLGDMSGAENIPDTLFSVQEQKNQGMVPYIELLPASGGNYYESIRWRLVRPDAPDTTVSSPFNGSLSVSLMVGGGEVKAGSSISLTAGQPATGEDIQLEESVTLGSEAEDGVTAVFVTVERENSSVLYTWYFQEEEPEEPLEIITESLDDGIVGEDYSDILEASGTDVIWSVTGGSLPDGLSLNTSTGYITGKPTKAGSFSFTVQAKDPGSSQEPPVKSLTITIEVAPPAITTNSLAGGYVGVNYSEEVKATGEGVTWSVGSGALPDGLSLSSAGKISGKPTKAGTFNFTLEASNSGGSNDKPFSIKIISGTAPAIKTTTLTEGTAGKAYSVTLSASGTKTITWSKSGQWPSGLTLSSAGKISGKAKAGGTYNFTVKAKNNFGQDTKALTLVIKDVKPAIKTGSLKNATVGKSYSATVSATGTGITWSVASGGVLPSGVTLNKSTGKLSGKPKMAGTFRFTVKAENTAGSATKAYTLKVVETKPTIKTSTLKTATVGTVYGATLSGTGTNIKWTWSGSRPAGLQLDASNGRISGTPKTAGTFKFTVKATNTGGTASKTVKLVVNDQKPVITTDSLKDGQLKTAYSETLEATTTNLKWTKSAGKLPTGLKLSTAGKITGTPTKAGTFNFTVKATSKKSSKVYATKKFSIRIVRQTKAGTADAMDYGPDEAFNEQDTGTGTPDTFAGQQDAVTPDGETDAGIIPGENSDRAELMVLSGDEALDGDMLEVAPEKPVTFAIGPWTDAEGNDVEVTNLKVYVDDEPYAVEVDTEGFTLPESLFVEGREFGVYVTAEAEGKLLKSKELYLIVWDGPANVPSAAQTEDPRNDSRSGCDAVGLGTLGLILSAAFFLGRKQKQNRN